MSAPFFRSQLNLVPVPRYVAAESPTIPSTVVNIEPEGSHLLPGSINFAIIPAANPIMIVQTRAITSSYLSGRSFMPWPST